jgi:hypothetical protein
MWTAADAALLRAGRTHVADPGTQQCVSVFPHTLGIVTDGYWEPLPEPMRLAATRCLVAATLATTQGMALVVAPAWLVAFLVEHTTNPSAIIPAPPPDVQPAFAALWSRRSYPNRHDLAPLVATAARIYRRRPEHATVGRSAR